MINENYGIGTLRKHASLRKCRRIANQQIMPTKGRDLCHSLASPVRISHYAVKYGQPVESGGAPGGVGTMLTGVAHFTNHAESHAGFCHGGSMTSVMDDIIGWTAFHVTGRCLPWSGYTAQINVSLQCPIAVETYLKVVGMVTKWEGRKVWVHARLVVGEGCEAGKNEAMKIVHCNAEGLVILKRGGENAFKQIS